MGAGKGPDERPADPAARAEALLRLGGTLSALVDDLPALRETATRLVAELAGDTVVLWELELRPGDDELVATSLWHQDPDARADLDRLGRHTRLPRSHGSFLWTVAQGPPLLLAELRPDDLQAVAPSYQEYFARWGLRSMIVVPLVVRGALLGVLGVSRDDARPPFDDDDLTLVTRVGGILALALDNAMLLHTARSELAERVRAQSALQHLARHDPLTGLPNRSHLLVELERSVAAGPTALVLLDLTGFKQINDSLGHHLGDHVLMDIAAALSSALPHPLQLARPGGDEFAVVVPHDGSSVEAVAWEVAERLTAALSEPRDVAGVRLHLGAGIGIAHLAPGEEDVDGPVTLLKRADLAMHRAKSQARSIAAWDPELDRDAEGRLRQIVELRDAITGGQLLMHYQPIVRSAGRSLHHVEALARWQHPTRGLLPAGAFIPLAEQAGLLVELADATTPLVLDQLDRWRRDDGPRMAALNVPAPVLTQDGFAGQLLDGLRVRGLPHSALLLELTESGLAEPAAVDVVAELAEAGIRWSVDDFGTGWSSLARLRELPLNELKIDRAFVTDLGHDPAARALVRGVVDVAHSLNLVTVAEGVETEDVAEVLTRLGVDYQQGWLHGRPTATLVVP